MIDDISLRRLGLVGQTVGGLMQDGGAAVLYNRLAVGDLEGAPQGREASLL